MTRKKTVKSLCGAPQGSIAGPLLFHLYVKLRLLYYHYYDDYIQSYISLALVDPSPISTFRVYCGHIDVDVPLSLLLNNTTEMIVFDARVKNKKLRLILIHCLLKL